MLKFVLNDINDNLLVIHIVHGTQYNIMTYRLCVRNNYYESYMVRWVVDDCLRLQ